MEATSESTFVQHLEVADDPRGGSDGAHIWTVGCSEAVEYPCRCWFTAQAMGMDGVGMFLLKNPLNHDH